MLVRRLGRCDYAATYAAMQAFSHRRDDDTPDELWLCEHDPVFTQGQAGRPEHVLAAANIPVVQTNRGGQVTYHGPGQVVAYPLINLRRRRLFVKEYVYRLEESLIACLNQLGVTGHRLAGAPGVYVRLADPFAHEVWPNPPDPRDPWRGWGKIAALGIKVERHYSYHGVALNVAMDVSPFSRINPCGYAGLTTVDLASLGVTADFSATEEMLSQKLQTYLS